LQHLAYYASVANKQKFQGLLMKRINLLFSFIVLLFMLTGCSDRIAIINNVDEREANEIVVFLASKGISADKQAAISGNVGGGGGPQMWNIYVDPGNITESLAILNRNGLPRKQGQNLLEIFGDTGLVPTDMQQKIRYQAGLAQQIANTIRQIDGVIDASVQISIPTDDQQTITAAVYVKHQGVLDNPNSQLITKIKQLVSGSVPGLKFENVTVISDRSRFTDVTLAGEQKTIEEEREYVSVWGVVVARNSVGLFRFYFIFFSVLILILIGILSWIIFKCLPYIKDNGGVSLFLDIPFIKKKNDSEPTNLAKIDEDSDTKTNSQEINQGEKIEEQEGPKNEQ
jgi:type III secretion protein J